MRAYDLEALAREVFERHAKRVGVLSKWNEIPEFLQGYHRANIRETIECYERQLEEQAKREARKGKR